MIVFRNIIFTLIIFFCYNTFSQVLPTEELFSYNSIFQQKFINISERIQEDLSLPYSCIEQLYYNANLDSEIDSTEKIQKVVGVSLFNNKEADALDLLDDGRHFDNYAMDGIYGNIWSYNFYDFNSNEFIISVYMDTIGIQYQVLEHPVFVLPAIPKINIPIHNSSISDNINNFFWVIDTAADGCGLILFKSKPVLGNELKNIIWEKKYLKNSTGKYIEKIPIELSANQQYTLLIWSYTDMKKVNNRWIRGSYSIEWSIFYIDSIMNQKNNFIVSQNFPNPFNSSTIIRCFIPEDDHVEISIFDILGNNIAKLLNMNISSGEQYLNWDGKNELGINIPSGIYFCRVSYRNNIITRKMVLIR